MNDLEFLYARTRGAREVLFEYLKTVPPNDLHQTHLAFGRGSLLENAAHIAGCYRFWVGEVGLKIPARDLEILPSTTLDDVQAEFLEVDAMVIQALEGFKDLEREFEWLDENGTLRVSGRWLLLHPITHEFQHKGQMLSLGRMLGYPAGPRFDTALPPPNG